ncbi:MAG: hypothetical protein AAGU23_03490 [Bacillota bacterium]
MAAVLRVKANGAAGSRRLTFTAVPQESMTGKRFLFAGQRIL